MSKLLSDEEIKDKFSEIQATAMEKHRLGLGDPHKYAQSEILNLINAQKRLYAESVINRIDTAYKYSSLEPDFTPYDAGKNRGLAIAVALLEGNEHQVIEDSAEQRGLNRWTMIR